MSYIALARKWRPRTFSELLGQEHLVRALTQSLTQNRVHHAYLFTGTRGVGKTSVGRIFAKALNCLQGISAQPCLECDNCQAIEQGRFIDLIEIDAASKTRVEDTRELLDNVQYSPTIGRYKIYLIDEVHMLSQHSFNALLKTLEEPPAHVKFLLATTDVQKLPITILSRCLQFHLKHVPESIITPHLQTILQSEAVTFEPQALAMIAKAARGSMRDALSLLDQCLAGRTEELTAVNVGGLLGQTTEDFAIQLLHALCAHDPQQLMTISRNITQAGGQFRYILDELLAYLHRVAIVQALPSTPDYIESQPEIALFAQQLAPEDTQLFYQIGVKGLSDFSYAPTPNIGFEMLLLRMYTFKPAPTAVVPKLAYKQPTQPQVEALSPSPAIVELTIPPIFAEEVIPASSRIVETSTVSQTDSPHSIPQMFEEEITPAATPIVDTSTVSQTDSPLSILQMFEEEVTPAATPIVDTSTVSQTNSPLSISQMFEEEVTPAATPIVDTNTAHQTDVDWASISAQLSLSGLALTAIQHTELLEKTPGQIILKVEKSHQAIFNNPVIARIQESLSTYYQEPIRVTLQYQTELLDTPAAQKKSANIKQQETYTQALQSDPIFQQLQKEFAADLIKDSITAT